MGLTCDVGILSSLGAMLGFGSPEASTVGFSVRAAVVGVSVGMLKAL